MYKIELMFSFENKEQLNDIIEYIGIDFENNSIGKLNGYYKGIKEKSRVLILITDNSLKTKAKIHNIINYIKEIANQESVLYIETKIKAELR